MNRRAFLGSAGAAASALAIPTLITHKAGALPGISNVNVPYSAGTLHAVASANFYKGRATAQDYLNLASIYSQLHSVWLASNLDNALRPGYNSVAEYMYFQPTRFHASTIASHIQPYYPLSAATLQTMMSNYFNYINFWHRGFISSILTNVRNPAYGIATYIKMSATYCSQLAGVFTTYRPVMTSPGKYTAEAGSASTIPHTEDPPGCKYDSLTLLAAGTALAVLTVMTDGLDLLAASAWEGISFWGGLGVANWSIAHAMLCGL